MMNCSDRQEYYAELMDSVVSDAAEPDLRPTVCPRCTGRLTDEEFYGVCTTCQSDLREKFTGEQRVVAVDDYVPKMNVTPNSVAAKE